MLQPQFHDYTFWKKFSWTMAVQGFVNLNPLEVYIIIYTLLRGVECLWGGRWEIPPTITVRLGLRRYTHAYPIHDNVVVATTDQLQHIPTSPKSRSPENNFDIDNEHSEIIFLSIVTSCNMLQKRKGKDNACPCLPTLAWIVGWGLDTHLFDLGPHQHYLRWKCSQLHYSLQFSFLRRFDPRMAIRCLELMHRDPLEMN
jgi:hypothetical protein